MHYYHFFLSFLLFFWQIHVDYFPNSLVSFHWHDLQISNIYFIPLGLEDSMEIMKSFSLPLATPFIGNWTNVGWNCFIWVICIQNIHHVHGSLSILSSLYSALDEAGNQHCAVHLWASHVVLSGMYCTWLMKSNTTCYTHSVSLVTYWHQSKMTNIWQTFSNAYSWMKIFLFWFQFCWSLLLRG